jgi:hypothetical protein
VPTLHVRSKNGGHAALVRFANEGYKAVLEATEKLKGLIDSPEEKPAKKKRGRPPRR